MTAPTPVVLPQPPLAPRLFAASYRVERLLAAALAFTGVGERGGNNRGEMVERFLRGVGLPPGAPWCAAFVHHVGRWSQYDPARRISLWPLPPTGACQALADAAAARGALVRRPTRGDLFLMWFPHLQRFAHTGIVLGVTETAEGFACTTIEGNTSTDGSRDGWATLIRSRIFPMGEPHRFVRWVEMPLLGGAAAPSGRGA